MDINRTRLQIAARIHFFLKRELGTGIDMETMLMRRRYAGEVLALCDAAKGTELERLAQQFRVATEAAEREEREERRRIRQPSAADTSGFSLLRSGFGLLRPLGEAPASPSRRKQP